MSIKAFNTQSRVKRKKCYLLGFLIILCISIGLIGCGGPDLGEKITANDSEVYYKDTVSKEQAQKLLDYLTIAYLTDDDEATFSINKNNDIYEVNVCIEKGNEKDKEIIENCKVLSSEVSMYVFNGAPVDIVLCDEDLNKLKVISSGSTINLGESLIFKKNILFYTSSIKKEDAQKLGDFLVEQEFFTEDSSSLQIDKINDIYTIKIPVIKDTEKDEELIDVFKEIASFISENVFNDELVEIHLCNDKFETLNAVSSTGQTLGNSLTSNGDLLYYTSTVTEAEAQNLLQYLADKGLFDGSGMLAQINKNYNTYELRLIIKKGLEQEQEVIDMMKLFSRELSKNIFKGQSVDIHLCDDSLDTLRVVVDF